MFPPGHRVFAVDLPGHGLSSHYPAGVTYNYMDCQQFIRRVADHFGLSRFSLLGHSMGGGMSMLFAATHPERVSRLIMLDIARPTSRKPADVVRMTRLHVDQFLQTETKLEASALPGKAPPAYTWEEAKERLIQGSSVFSF
jgi:pimeloyl-ACP methyl ester carboxylesterase